MTSRADNPDPASKRTATRHSSAPDRTLRIAIAEDHQMIRKAWVLLLAEWKNLRVVGEVANGQELLDLLGQQRVDVVLLDMEMPVMSGLEAATRISQQFADVKIIALTMQKDLGTLRQFMAHGAVGYVTKNAGQQELYEAIMAVSSGKKYVCTEVSEVLKLAAANRATTLTRRETEVVRHIVAGLSSREIAGKLFLSLKTVEAHRGNVFRKLNVKNVAELIRKAREVGL